MRPARPDDVDELTQLVLAAWDPVFAAMESEMGTDLFDLDRPDWRGAETKQIRMVCADETYDAWVAEAGAIVGFTVLRTNDETLKGEIFLTAVHPDHQRLGVGTMMNRFAIERLTGAGMKIIYVGTGSDPGHTPARAAYERAGFSRLPSQPVIYYLTA